MNEEDQNDRNDPELEARVVADVLGEASDLEHNQLSKLIEDNPELAAKKEQFIRVDELLRDVAQGEFDVEDSDWKLPEDRRAAVSAVLQSKLSMQTDTVSPVGTVILGQSIPNVFWSKTRLTAVLVAAVFCGLMVMTSYSYLNTRDRLRVSQSAAELKRSPATVSDWEDFYVDSEAAARNYSAAEKPEFESDYSIVPQQPTDSESDTRFEYSNNSKSALSAIRDRLAVVPQTIEPKRLAEENLGDPRDFGSGSSFSRSTIEDSPTTPLPDLKLSIENATNASDFDVSSSKDQKDGTELSTPSGEFLNRADMVESRRRIQTPNHWDESFELPLGQADKPAEAESQSGSPQEWMKNKSGAIVAGGAQFKREVDTPSSQNMPRFGEQSGQGQVDATLGSSFYGTNLKYSFEAAGSESAEKELSNDGGLARGELNGDFSGSNSNMMFDDASNSPTSRPDDSKSPRETIRYRGVEGTSLLTKEKQLELNRHSPSQDKAERGQVRTAAKEAGKKGDMSESAVEGPAKQQTEMRKRDWSRTSAPPAGLNETNAATEAFSTFSLHVSDVSFKLAQAALANGQWPDPEKVRIEEFVNAFDYGDPIPAHGEKVACRIEQSIHPFLQQRNLLRVSLRTAATGRSNNTPLRLTFLLDNSGSMERADRRQTIRRAFSLLAQQLTPNDQSTLISFARQPRLLVDKVGGDQSQQLISLIDGLPSEGGTNIELALQLAFEKALEQRADGAQNRIVLLTDGAVNLGDADPERLSKLITTIRDAGVAFDAAGICAEGLNDEVLEALTRNGDGRYYLLDTPDSADASFVRQIAGALRPSAKNVKVQIEFNPNRVGRYKLLGFEKHLLKQEDFRNDQVDAAEMAAAEAGVAIYQVETKPDGEGDIGSVSVRFRNLSTGQMIESRWPILYEANAPRPDQATPAIRIATSAALLAAKLRGEPLGETVDLKTLSDLISGLPDRNRNSDRVGQLRQMIDQTRQISGN